MHSNWPFLVFLVSLSVYRKCQYVHFGLCSPRAVILPGLIKIKKRAPCMEFEYKTWPSQLPFDFMQTISVVFQKNWHSKSSVWYSLFSQGLAFFSSLEFMSFVPIPLILLELLGQWSLAAALVLASTKSVAYPTRETASSRNRRLLSFLFLSKCFLFRFCFSGGRMKCVCS